MAAGIFVVLLSFKDCESGQLDQHFVAVDCCWRQIILDNAEATPIPFAGRNSKALLKRISCRNMVRAWQCMVRSTRLAETQYA